MVGEGIKAIPLNTGRNVSLLLFFFIVITHQ